MRHPGASYLTGLHILITSGSSTANQVVGVILFVLIEFLLIIIPFVFLELRPEATKVRLKTAQDWLLGHARDLMAYTALILGAYLAISALVRLSWAVRRPSTCWSTGRSRHSGYAVLQHECLVSAGIWCCVTFLIHAIRAARETRDAPLHCWPGQTPAGTVAGILRISRIRRARPARIIAGTSPSTEARWSDSHAQVPEDSWLPLEAASWWLVCPQARRLPARSRQGRPP